MAKTKALVDVVIPTSGRFDMLEKCLVSVFKNATKPLSVTIVDDGTERKERTENESIFTKNHYVDISNMVVGWKVIRHEKPEGFPKSCNEGARNGNGKYILFLNDDVELHDNYFDNLMDVLEKNEDIGVCGTRLLFPAESLSSIRPAGKIQHVGLALDVRANVVHPMVGWSATNPKTIFVREAWAVTGAAMTVRRQLFQKVGGFDLIYGMGTFEDADLCLKIRSIGYKIYLDHRISGTHYTGATVERKRIAYPLQQNAMIFKAKWGSSGYLVHDLWTY